MSFRIQNNIESMNSLRHLNRNSSAMARSLERLSSGYRINSAADDAAGMASSTRLRAEISSLKVASRNAAEATSLLQVAEGATGQLDLILNRMKELATQASSGNAGTDRDKIQDEFSALKNEVDRIVDFTKYNGQKLLDGNFGAVSFTTTSLVGLTNDNGVENIDVTNGKANFAYYISAMDTTANTITLKEWDIAGATTTGIAQTVSYNTAASLGENENYTLDFTSLGVKMQVNKAFATNEATIASNASVSYTAGTTPGFKTDSTTPVASFQLGPENAAQHRISFSLSNLNATGLGITSLDLSTLSGAQTALTTIDTAVSTLALQRGKMGSLINRLSYASSNLAVSIENKTASESTIRDVDMAAEMSEFSKNQILVQSSTAMLAQANAASQNVLSLLR